MDFYGIRLLGFNSENGRKLLFTLGLIFLVVAVRASITHGARLLLSGEKNEKPRFWTNQIANLVAAALIILGVLSIWFDDPTRLTTAAGLITAGLAFALQKFITSIAAYFVILRSRVYTVGDRILLAGVRGDVIRLGFVQTTVMEMGQPPGERPDEPNVWVKSRQFTGRIVTITNDKIFDSPVFNYSREFPFLWEEVHLPIAYDDDFRKAEKILLEAAQKHAVNSSEIKDSDLERIEQHFFVRRESLKPRTYLRLTDNWIELSVRFITHVHGGRPIKDAMARDILDAFTASGITVASNTLEITGLPPIAAHLDGDKHGKQKH